MALTVYNHTPGEAFTYSVDWDTKVTELQTSVQSVDWSVYSGQADIENQTLLNNIGKVTITTLSPGKVIIEAMATFADGQYDKYHFQIDVAWPQLV